MGFFDFFGLKAKTSKRSLTELYTKRGYNKIPSLPSEEECSRILQESESFPASLVAKEYMDYVDDRLELTFGHIVMLWWLNNPRTNKTNVPLYFLYQYGLNFEEEIITLQRKGILIDRDLTQLGHEKLEQYKDIVRKHKARKSYENDGRIIFHFEDAQRVADSKKFESTGDYVEDQFLGKGFEQLKDLDNAELAYLSSIELSLKKGETPPPNPFMRLAIIYRKQKRLEEEEEILKQGLYYISQSKAVNADSKNNIFQERLDKLQKLKEKHTC